MKRINIWHNVDGFDFFLNDQTHSYYGGSPNLFGSNGNSLYGRKRYNDEPSTIEIE